MSRRDELVATVVAQGPDDNEVVVSLEDFFEGNSDLSSIGANLGDEQPPIAEFYRVLREIRARDEVQDVLVRICEIGDEETWPYTDTVYILSSFTRDEIANLLEPLAPDEVSEGWMYGTPPAAPDVQPPLAPHSVWWD